MNLAVNFNAANRTDPATNEHVDVQADHYKVVREIGAAGTVLLKNVGGALPLKAPKSIAIIGEERSRGYQELDLKEGIF